MAIYNQCVIAPPRADFRASECNGYFAPNRLKADIVIAISSINGAVIGAY